MKLIIGLGLDGHVYSDVFGETV
jgi:hypothetical protein